MPRAPLPRSLLCLLPLLLIGQTSAPATRPGMRAVAQVATQPSTMPERKQITPEMIAAIGGPSVQEQELRALRVTLGASVEEWKVIGPLLGNVVSAQRGLDPGNGPDGATQGWRNRNFSNGSFTGPGETARGDPRGFGTPSDNSPDVPTDAARQIAESADSQSSVAQGVTLAQAMSDLHRALAAKDTPPEELKRRVAAVRAARQHATQVRTDAITELLPLLTPRQVGLLETMGYFE